MAAGNNTSLRCDILRKQMQNKNPRKFALSRLWLPALLILAGVILILAQFYGEVTLLVNGAERQARALAFTPGQLLRAAGYTLQAEDEVSPARNRLNLTHRTIVLNQAREVFIQTAEGGKTVLSAQALPANLLAEAGLTWFPGDWLLWEGTPLSPSAPLPSGEDLRLEFVPAKRVDLQFETGTRTFFT